VRYRVITILFVLAVFVVPPARCDLQRQMRQSYAGKLLSLRIPSNFDVLQYDASGQPARPGNGEPWTTCGLFKVKKISVSLGQMMIDGDRAAVILNPDPTKKLLLVILDRTLHVVIDLPPSVHSLSDMNGLLARIFVPGDLQTRMTAAWKAEVDLNRDLEAISRTVPEGRVGTLAENRPVYVVNAVPTPPKAVYKPSPEYSRAAVLKKIGGTVRVRMVVNESGYPEILEVLQHQREGLDSRALAAVSQWRFKPALRESMPVAAMLIVDVKFSVR
jgi:TonB family protein